MNHKFSQVSSRNVNQIKKGGIVFQFFFGDKEKNDVLTLKLEAMKRTVIFGWLMIISVIAFGQEKKQYSNEIYGVKVSPPRFTGNEELKTKLNEKEVGSLNTYLTRHFQYPENSIMFQEEGTEVVRFVVTPEGELTDFNVINSVSPEIDTEVLRVLKSSDRMWKPGLNNGEPVAMEKEISIAIKFNRMGDGINYIENFVDLAQRYVVKGNKKMFAQKNCKGALKYYDYAMRYLPNDKSLLVTRGLCKYELGDTQGAYRDWTRIRTLGGLDGDAYLDNLCGLKGFPEMISTIQGVK